MVARWALAAALAFAPTTIAAQDTDADDPYIWLEEIQGERALAKVDQWNADTEAVLTDQPEYPLAKAWAKQILDDTRQIALPDAIRNFKEVVSTDKVADGVWFVAGGSHNSVAIEMKDSDDEVFRAAEELGIDLSRREPSSVEEV